jgi:hypothetical protein
MTFGLTLILIDLVLDFVAGYSFPGSSQETPDCRIINRHLDT